MKRRNVRWVSVALGTALLIGLLGMGVAYLKVQREILSIERYGTLVDRAYYNEQVSLVLKQFRNGDAVGAADRLDLTLCDEILRIESETGAADGKTREFALETYRMIARLRPSRPGMTASNGVPRQCSADQVAAQKILELAAETGGGGAGNPKQANQVLAGED